MLNVTIAATASQEAADADLALLPEGTTIEDVASIFGPRSGTPTSDEEAVPGLGALSPGQTSWLALDLEPGTYVALCFVPDKQTGAPHAAMGMVQIFTVGEEMGTPAA